MDKLLTTAEVAELTRVSLHTVRAWRQNGLGPIGFRVGGRVVYRERDVERWVDEQRSKGAA